MIHWWFIPICGLAWVKYLIFFIMSVTVLLCTSMCVCYYYASDSLDWRQAKYFLSIRSSEHAFVRYISCEHHIFKINKPMSTQIGTIDPRPKTWNSRHWRPENQKSRSQEAKIIFGRLTQLWFLTLLVRMGFYMLFNMDLCGLLRKSWRPPNRHSVPQWCGVSFVLIHRTRILNQVKWWSQQRWWRWWFINKQKHRISTKDEKQKKSKHYGLQ